MQTNKRLLVLINRTRVGAAASPSRVWIEARDTPPPLPPPSLARSLDSRRADSRLTCGGLVRSPKGLAS